MREFIEYTCFVIYDCADLEELENHLSMNGYDFGIDKNKKFLFVYIEEMSYIETILTDRDIRYEIKEY